MGPHCQVNALELTKWPSATMSAVCGAEIRSVARQKRHATAAKMIVHPAIPCVLLFMRPDVTTKERVMHQSGDGLGTPRLDFEAWGALLRSNCGGEVEVTKPHAPAGWMRPLAVCGLVAAAVKIEWGDAIADVGRHTHRVERTSAWIAMLQTLTAVPTSN